ncbi:MAG TPA: sulfite exporter TauE/SafE family protein [Gammaproteobacteria bacterium]|nr:sulfite exporter TauE/SafE family protein [Gammaproteobacteria bacterium]
MAATSLILLRPVLVRQRHIGRRPSFVSASWPVAVVVTFVVAVYGGYFGADIGILMISALSFMGLNEIRQVLALKNLLAGSLRGVAVPVLLADGLVNWEHGLPTALGGLVGGYFGSMLLGRANPTIVRWIVIGIGFFVTAYYFWALYGSLVPRIGAE